MKIPSSLILLAALVAPVPAALASDRLLVTVSQALDLARPGEVVTVPWAEIVKRLPDARPEKLLIRDAIGSIAPLPVHQFPSRRSAGALRRRALPAQFRRRRAHSRLHDREPCRCRPHPFPHAPSRAMCPSATTTSPGRTTTSRTASTGRRSTLRRPECSQITSSGIDVWAKRVRYLIVDRWYIRGHNNYHKDNGEGFDFYSVGTGRGCGGTGIWDGKVLHVSHEWSSWRVYANGPLRSVFELTYAPWDAGGGVMRVRGQALHGRCRSQPGRDGEHVHVHGRS
jgi:hypothetical protein